MSLPAAMESFVPLASISPYTMTTLAPHLPEALQDLLAYGVGYIGDGMMRTLDPVSLAGVTAKLASPIHASHSFPILTSAFGDVVTHWRSRLYLIQARLGRYIGLGRAEHIGQILVELSDPAKRNFLLGELPWAQAVHAFGVPTPKECFAYVPPLAVQPRTPTEITGLQRVDLAQHLAFLAAFYGPAQGQW